MKDKVTLTKAELADLMFEKVELTGHMLNSCAGNPMVVLTFGIRF